MASSSSIQRNTKFLTSPLCGNDGGFTYTSIVKRLPDILDTIIEHNRTVLTQQQMSSLQELRNNIAQGSTISSIQLTQNILDDNDDERRDWIRFQDQFGSREKTWLELPWFFVENWVYKLVLDIVGYDQTGMDPFEKQKQTSLVQAFQSGAVSALAKSVHQFLEKIKQQELNNESIRKEFLAFLIGADLWGNKADLSFSAGEASKDEEIREHSTAHELRTQYIVDDDSNEVIDEILSQVRSKNLTDFNFIVDNCGLELVCDLFFGHALIECFDAKQVTYYVKTQPVFVSDAMNKDVKYTIDQLCMSDDEMVRQFGLAFKTHLHESKWVIEEHKFFTGPLPFYEMPDDLSLILKQTGQFTILKGDANYRRLFNDRNYDTQLSFSELVDYFPTNLLALRTLKSDCLVGLTLPDQQEKAHKLNQQEPDWRVNGKYGVISFARKPIE